MLAAVRSGASCATALNLLSSQQRPGVQALSFLALRHLGRALVLRQILARRPPPAATDALLLTALALMWHNDDDDAAEPAPYQAFTLVDQAVEAAQQTRAMRSGAAFVNACLRRFLRERACLVAQSDPVPLARWNHPEWWVNRLQTDWPTRWMTMLEANNRHAPLTLRVNSRKTSVNNYLLMLGSAGMAATRVGPHGVHLHAACAVDVIPGFADGLVSVQDASAQRAAPLLLSGWTVRAGEPDNNQVKHHAPLRVLDACAAPGGKTAHLLELANLQLTALDIDAERCDRVRQTLQRLGLVAQVVQADAADPSSWWDGILFDAVMLDAPCSASGVVRRHPDIRWLRRPTDIAQMVQTQARLLQSLWPLLKPGGRMLYAVCSVFKAEGDDTIQAFMAGRTDVQCLPLARNAGNFDDFDDFDDLDDVQADGPDGDGFFYALLQKSAK